MDGMHELAEQLEHLVQRKRYTGARSVVRCIAPKAPAPPV